MDEPLDEHRHRRARAVRSTLAVDANALRIRRSDASADGVQHLVRAADPQDRFVLTREGGVGEVLGDARGAHGDRHVAESREPYASIVMGAPRVADLVGRERVLDIHPQLGPRIQTMLAGLTARLADPAGDNLALLRATAAIGAIRRPVLRPEIDHQPHLEELVDAATAALRT